MEAAFELGAIEWEWTSSGARICAEEWMGDALAFGQCEQGGFAWEYRTCLRRFSRRVTTAELIMRCPDMPSTQRCRLPIRIEHMFSFVNLEDAKRWSKLRTALELYRGCRLAA